MLHQLRSELAAALNTWDAADSAIEDRTELDALCHRILRMAEIMKKMRDIVELN